MAPRKDRMQIIRRDSGFSAQLGFGGAAERPAKILLEPGRSKAEDIALVPWDSREGEGELGAAVAPSAVSGTARGSVVYVAVSLTPRQAELAKAWAEAACCPVSLLIRRVAQDLRDEICSDWADGMPQVDELRGTRGKCPTSVTLTLPPDFAAALKARHDPLGILGFGRAIGPAFRQRFETAFDAALAKVNFKTKDQEGEAQ